ncbi:hypothetical protein [Terrabacter sp. NPDC080008]|uniref:hypothetical protein n=1 Tax=Terrabacter sp. NPDC080008 TaxID=3155176 RepID=UPI00344B012A
MIATAVHAAEVPGAVFTLEHVDHATLTVDRLPRSSNLLECATCGISRGRHPARHGSCASFTRPRLPDGYRYLDEVEEGTPIRAFGQPGSDVEVVSAIEPLDAGRPMLRVVTHTLTRPWTTSVTRYVSADGIVAV